MNQLKNHLLVANLFVGLMLMASLASAQGTPPPQPASPMGPAPATVDLPFSGSVATDSAAFFIRNTGTGVAINGRGTSKRGVVGISDTGNEGVFGQSSGLNAAGVRGFANNGTGAAGVAGRSNGGLGVIGQSTTNVGVRGTSDTGRAVEGFSTSGIGVIGNSSTRGVVGTLGDTSCAGTYAVGGCGTTSGIGVIGDSTTRGVVGTLGGTSCAGTYAVGGCGTTSGIGVLGNSTTRGVVGTLGDTSCAGQYAVGGCAGSTGVYGVFGRSQNGAGVVGSTDTGDVFIGVVGNAETHVARIDETGRGFFNGGTQGSGADYADSMPTSDNPAQLEPGDVLAIDPQQANAVRQSREPNSRLIAGVYSTQPSVLGVGKHGLDDSLAGEVPVALVGIVPTKVTAENGPIQIGDLLVTSSLPGHAMKAQPEVVDGVMVYPTGAILGKALEALPQGTGVIQVLVTLR